MPPAAKGSFVLLTLALCVIAGCAAPLSLPSTKPWLGHWVGTFAYEADEMLTAKECVVHRIERASGTVNCGPETITVNASVSEERDLTREIVFDSDQPADYAGPLRVFGDTIGSQCNVTTPTGHRRLTVKLTRS